MSERRQRRLHIPSHLLGGRLRTTTLILCSLWVGLWLLYLFLNQPDEPGPGAPATAVIISETPYVPYVPPAPVEEAPSRSVPETAAPTGTDTPTPVPTTAGTTPPAPTAPPTTSTVPPNRPFPFELPQIPGLMPQQGPDGTDGSNEMEP